VDLVVSVRKSFQCGIDVGQRHRSERAKSGRVSLHHLRTRASTRRRFQTLEKHRPIGSRHPGMHIHLDTNCKKGKRGTLLTTRDLFFGDAISIPSLRPIPNEPGSMLTPGLHQQDAKTPTLSQHRERIGHPRVLLDRVKGKNIALGPLERCRVGLRGTKKKGPCKTNLNRWV